MSYTSSIVKTTICIYRTTIVSCTYKNCDGCVKLWGLIAYDEGAGVLNDVNRLLRDSNKWLSKHPSLRLMKNTGLILYRLKYIRPKKRVSCFFRAQNSVHRAASGHFFPHNKRIHIVYSNSVVFERKYVLRRVVSFCVVCSINIFLYVVR